MAMQYYYHLAPQQPGILWRVAEGLLMLLAAAVYGPSCRLVFGSRSRAVRGSFEIALVLFPFSLAGVIAAEIIWLCNDLSRVLFVRNPA